MRLWLIRHAHAEDGATDASRKLSPLGNRQVAALAEFLRSREIRPPDELWHSPLRRARETAESLLRDWRQAIPLRQTDLLLPGADISRLPGTLADRDGDIAIIGHLPHLGRLASWLLAADPDVATFQIQNTTLVCLENTESNLPANWFVSWMVSPEILGVRGRA